MTTDEMKALAEAPKPTYDANLGAITAQDREYAQEIAEWLRKIRYEAVMADRNSRVVPKPASELSSNLRKWAAALDIPSGPFVNEDCRLAADTIDAQINAIQAEIESRRAVFHQQQDALSACGARLATAERLAKAVAEYMLEFSAPVPDYGLRRVLRQSMWDALAVFRAAQGSTAPGNGQSRAGRRNEEDAS